ncbi:acyl carrier protein, partial [Campylobacter jejuni]
LEDILMLESGILKEDSCLKNFEDWDSLAYLNLMAFFDTQLNINITADEISQLNTVADVLNLAKIQ